MSESLVWRLMVPVMEPMAIFGAENFYIATCRILSGSRISNTCRFLAVTVASNLKVETPDAFPKSGPIPGLGAPKAVLDAVFAAKAGETKGPVALDARGAVVFRVDSVTPFDAAAFEREKAALKEQLRGQKASRVLQALIQRQRSDLKVEFNKDLLSRMAGSRT